MFRHLYHYLVTVGEGSNALYLESSSLGLHWHQSETDLLRPSLLGGLVKDGLVPSLHSCASPPPPPLQASLLPPPGQMLFWRPSFFCWREQGDEEATVSECQTREKGSERERGRERQTISPHPEEPNEEEEEEYGGQRNNNDDSHSNYCCQWWCLWKIVIWFQTTTISNIFPFVSPLLAKYCSGTHSTHK